MRRSEALVAMTLRSTVLCGGIATAVLLSGCGGDTSARDESVAEIYTAATQWLVDDARDAGAPAPQTIFLEPVGGDPISLPVQAEVVSRLDDGVAVRFIDTKEEAVDTSEPADPVRDDGILIGLGPVRDPRRPPVRLYADRYRDVRDVVAYEIDFEREAGRWHVTGEPQQVPVEDGDRVPAE